MPRQCAPNEYWQFSFLRRNKKKIFSWVQLLFCLNTVSYLDISRAPDKQDIQMIIGTLHLKAYRSNHFVCLSFYPQFSYLCISPAMYTRSHSSITARSFCTSSSQLLRGLRSPRKSVCSLTDYLDMTVTVLTGHKTRWALSILLTADWCLFVSL